MQLVSADAPPEKVAALAAKVAREHMTDPRTRPAALEALAPHYTIAVGSEDRKVGSSGRFWRDMTGTAWSDALGRWAQSITFVREPASIGEIVMAPWRLAAYRAGDCDDLAAAAACFAAIAGLPALIALTPAADGFAHVRAAIGDSWLPQHKARITHTIDFDGATVAPDDLLTSHTIFPVSFGL